MTPVDVAHPPVGGVTCAGIAVADVVVHPVPAALDVGHLTLVDGVELRAGGCALSTATALARLGTPASVVARVGRDPFGRFLLEHAASERLDTTGMRAIGELPTSASVVAVDATGERTFLHLPGANSALTAAVVDLPIAGRILHLGGLLMLPGLDGDPAGALFAAARSAGITTSLDTVWTSDGDWRRALPAIEQADIFAPGLDEAREITGEADPARIAAWLRERGVAVVAIKMGARGCYVSGQSFTGPVPAIAVDVVDGTGAGDCFVAGLLHGLLQGWPLQRAAALGNAAGAAAVTATGATEGLRDSQTVMRLLARLDNHHERRTNA